jgi:hypothetical protein
MQSVGESYPLFFFSFMLADSILCRGEREARMSKSLRATQRIARCGAAGPFLNRVVSTAQRFST